MRFPTLPLLALLAVALAPAASAGVIVPQVDPHLDEGYVDVYYHDCPVTGSDPCDHHHVTRVEAPCYDADVRQEGDKVVVAFCGYEYEVPTPCTDLSVAPDATGPTYGATVTNCGDDTTAESPCIDPDAGVEDGWGWYGDVWVVHAGNCNTGVEQEVCQEPVEMSVDEVVQRNPLDCRETNCWGWDAYTQSGNRVTVEAGRCNNPPGVTTPCADPSVTPDTTGPFYGATVENCGEGETVQSPCIDPDAGVEDGWGWDGRVWVVHAGNCSTEVEREVCQEPLEFSVDRIVQRDTQDCRETNCWMWDASSNPDGSVTVAVGRCNNPTEIDTPCLDADGTDVGPEGDGVRVTVVVCDDELVDQTVTPPTPTAPCASAGSGGGNTLYVRIYPTCDYSDPGDPQPTSEPIEQEIHLGP